MFKGVEKDVKAILEKNRAARCNDMYLYSVYCTTKAKGKAANIVGEAFTNLIYRFENNIAPYETVSRCRRKIQAENPRLKPSKAELKKKLEAEKAYREYAKE